MDVSPPEPDEDTAEALRFRVLVVACHNELRKRQNRFAPMVGECSGFPWLSHIFPLSLNGPSNGGGCWCAKPVPAKPFGSPPRFVQRDAHEVRLGEAEQPRL